MLILVIKKNQNAVVKSKIFKPCRSFEVIAFVPCVKTSTQQTVIHKTKVSEDNKLSPNDHFLTYKHLSPILMLVSFQAISQATTCPIMFYKAPTSHKTQWRIRVQTISNYLDSKGCKPQCSLIWRDYTWRNLKLYLRQYKFCKI